MKMATPSEGDAVDENAALLVAKFTLVDAAFCFLSRHRAVTSVHNVLNMANSFGGVTLAAGDLRTMARIAPELLAIDVLKSNQIQHKGKVELATRT